MKTLKIASGIGDNLWMFQKLINTGEDFKIEVANDDPYQRVRVLFDILPKRCANSITYSNFSIEEALNNNKQKYVNKWNDIFDNEFYLTINHHLENGNRIELWLEDLPITFNMGNIFETSTYKKEVADLLSDNNKYIGLYTSSYSTNRHWGFWDENKWFELIKLLQSVYPFTFVLIGADYDIDLGNSIINLMNLHHIPYINTIGKKLNFVVEVIKKLSYGFYFPSGIGVLAASLYSPHTMFFPKHLELMQNTFQAPELIDSDIVKHCQYCEPEVIFNWWKNSYNGLKKI